MVVDTFDLKRAAIPGSQRRERGLLLLAGAFILINFLALFIQRPAASWLDGLHGLVWLLCAISGHVFLNRTLPGRDPLLFPVTMFLSGWGLVAIDRLAPVFAERQTAWLVVATTALGAVAGLPHLLRWLRSYRYLLLACGLLLLVSTIVLGVNPSGLSSAPQLWLGTGTIFFQPSEVLKIILVAFLASYLAEQFPAFRAEGLEHHRLHLSPRVIGPMLLMWGLSIVVLIWQRDLGTAILFFTVFLLLIYVASGYSLLLVGGACLTVAAGWAAYHAFGVVQLRVDIWINPWPESDGRAYQIVQSLLAFASGGILGQGVGQGSPGYIPVVHSDFIFAAIAEEWGLLGILSIIGCIAVLVGRGLHCALRLQRRSFLALMAVGLSVTLGVQSLLIMMGVLKLLPLTGVTLPFMSYGGSSLLTCFTMIGLLLRLSALED
jgi:cell division protein FtsW